MRFYIISGINPEIRCNISSADYNSTDYIATISAFINKIYDTKFSHSYLIADFENNKQKMFNYATIDKDSDVLPFVIIAECHDGDIEIRRDTLYILSKGITEEFSSNKAAIEKFISLKNIECNLYLRSKDEFGNTKIYYIANSEDITDCKNMSIKNIAIKDLSWLSSNPKIKTRKFSKTEYENLIKKIG